MSSATSYHDTEVRIYFTACAELRDARKANGSTTAVFALNELTGIWLHSTNANLRDRCAEVLENNGRSAEMASYFNEDVD